MKGIFVSDIHGSIPRFQRLFQIIRKETPDAVFLGGDLLPLHPMKHTTMEEFIETTIFSEMKKIKRNGDKKIRFFVIMGNDDPRMYEHLFMKADNAGILDYIHQKTIFYKKMYITGYSFIPPTPFQLKDWERYDVSEYIDVGAISPEQGRRTIDVPLDEIKYSTIAEDLEKLSKQSIANNTIYLFHSPPYQSCLDRADLHGKKVDHAPVDVHVGSIAIQRFIKTIQPLLTLHGHVHESAHITGWWKEKVDRTYSFTAAHYGPELAVVRFDTNHLENATRELIPVS
ncbi:MAG: metallophosphoesterase [Euryarchaeota archaeon]|nr:metallophosphoesterase [Euryarchaeota archaeon]